MASALIRRSCRPALFLMLAALWLISGCTAPAQRQAAERAAERAAVKKQVSEEIARICALPESERQTEIEKVKEESNLAIVCPTP